MQIDRVSFGLLSKADFDRALAKDPNMPRTRAKLAVPFVGKDVPSESSEFAHPDVIIGLTILAYRYEGLRWTDFNDIIANLRSTLTLEVGPYSERKSSVRYAQWVKDAGGRVRSSNYLPDTSKGKQKIDQVCAIVLLISAELSLSLNHQCSFTRTKMTKTKWFHFVC